MSIKTAKSYYDEFYMNYYKSALKDLNKIDQIASTKLISPTEVEDIKKNYQFIMEYFKSLAFIFYTYETSGIAGVRVEFENVKTLYEGMLQDLETLRKEGVDQQSIEIIEELNYPVVYSYNNFKYILYLFNMPNNKKRRKRYIKQFQNSLPERKFTKEGVLEESNRAISYGKQKYQLDS